MRLCKQQYLGGGALHLQEEFGGNAKPTEKVSRDMLYRNDSVGAIWGHQVSMQIWKQVDKGLNSNLPPKTEHRKLPKRIFASGSRLWPRGWCTQALASARKAISRWSTEVHDPTTSGKLPSKAVPVKKIVRSALMIILSLIR